MTTEAEVQANQANAQHSTGPRTPEGKSISSLNALKHGLTAATVLLPGEDPEVYQCFTAGMLDAFNPLNTAETALVFELVDAQWRIRRGSRFEARILSAESPDMKALNNLGIHTARLKRQYSAALKEFQHMHRENLKHREEQLKEAEQVYRADNLLERPSTFETFGFDFKVEELEDRMVRNELIEEARETVKKFEYGLDDASIAELAALDDAA